MDAILLNAIPQALDFVGAGMNKDTLLEARRAGRKHREMYELCSYDWDYDILDPNADPASNVVHVLHYRDIMALPEFLVRLGNILSTRNKVMATVHRPEHDYKVDSECNIARNEVYLVVEFRPWKNETVEYSECLRVGEADQHVLTKTGVCLFCGACKLVG